MEVERDHALGVAPGGEEDPFALENALLLEADRSEDGLDGLAFEALEAEACFDRVLFDGGEFGAQAEVGSAEEADFIGLPGLLEPDQVAALLRARSSVQAGRTGHGAASPAEEQRAAALHRAIPALRKELNGLVGAWHHRTGSPHGVVHTELRQACGGPLAVQASVEQLQARIDLIRTWALRRR